MWQIKEKHTETSLEWHILLNGERVEAISVQHCPTAELLAEGKRKVEERFPIVEEFYRKKLNLPHTDCPQFASKT